MTNKNTRLQTPSKDNRPGKQSSLSGPASTASNTRTRSAGSSSAPSNRGTARTASTASSNAQTKESLLKQGIKYGLAVAGGAGAAGLGAYGYSRYRKPQPRKKHKPCTSCAKAYAKYLRCRAAHC